MLSTPSTPIPWRCTLNKERSIVIDCFTEKLYQNRYNMINDPPLSKAHMPTNSKLWKSSSAVTTPLYNGNECNPWIMSVFACTSCQPCAYVFSTAFSFNIKLVILVNRYYIERPPLMYINFLRVSQEAKKTNLHQNSRKGCCFCFG